MVLSCTLSGLTTWFTCAESGLPFTEILTMAIFMVFFLIFSPYGFRKALPTSLIIASFTAAVFLGIGAINPIFVAGTAILTALSVVFLNNQNNPF